MSEKNKAFDLLAEFKIHPEDLIVPKKQDFVGPPMMDLTALGVNLKKIQKNIDDTLFLEDDTQIFSEIDEALAKNHPLKGEIQDGLSYISISSEDGSSFETILVGTKTLLEMSQDSEIQKKNPHLSDLIQSKIKKTNLVIIFDPQSQLLLPLPVEQFIYVLNLNQDLITLNLK